MATTLVVFYLDLNRCKHQLTIRNFYDYHSEKRSWNLASLKPTISLSPFQLLRYIFLIDHAENKYYHPLVTIPCKDCCVLYIPYTSETSIPSIML
jgi:hypothetical protein